MMMIECEDKQAKRPPAKKKKPVVVEARFSPKTEFAYFSKEWFKFGKYLSRKVAEEVIAREMVKKDHMEFRIKGD